MNNISVYNNLTEDWVPKITRNGRLITNSMYPEWWTGDRVKVENDFAYQNRVEFYRGDILMWRGNTISGIDVEGYLDSNVTVYPKIR